jgi:ubiquinol-cytochrome c reductase cytochrome c1 subunit
MKNLLIALLLAPTLALASEAGYRLDRSPHDQHDVVSLQAGARTYMNYCLGCHGLQYMRYDGLKHLELSEAQIRDNLMFTGQKIGDPIKIAVNPKDAKAWFGVAPPDLSVIARSRGADWLYTYLRTFYRDEKAPSGWNNAVFPNVGMPHVLYSMQGVRKLEVQSPKEGHGPVQYKWSEIAKGTQAPAEYDATVRDLVNFLVYVGEPAGGHRRSIGIVMLFVLGVVFIFAYLLKKEYWKDVK